MSDALTTLEEEFALLRRPDRDIPLPPPCFLALEGRFTDYKSRTMLQARFPVQHAHTNPVGTMQGGFVAAAMDNVLGPLSYLAARSICVTLDLSTQYVRGAASGEMLTITATVVSRSLSHILMTAEAVNAKGKLIATATSTVLIMKA